MGLRQERLADEIRDIVASLFTGGTLNDPRIQDVTVTAAKVSPDLQVATIYYRVYGEEVDAKQVQKGMEAATSFMRKKIGSALELRRVPDLRFFFDESIDKASDIERLLMDLKKS